ncbi:glycosyltransferase family 2 protein [Chloroflexota bacterium]
MLDYILLTPAKDEEQNLPRLADSVINQTLLPRLWVIIDDGSTDGTPRVIEKLVRDYNWIKSIKLEVGPRQAGINFARMFNKGLNYAYEICRDMGISYDYLGKADADIIMPEDCFQTLIDRFRENPRLGIASPGMASISGEVTSINDLTGATIIHDVNSFSDLPSDGVRLYRKECFDEIGGIAVTHAPDPVALVKAKLRGWETRRDKESEVFKTRETASTNGLWNGYKIVGYEKYYMDYHPFLVLLSTLYELKRRPYYQGLALFYGYLSAVLRREEKIDIPEVRDYFRHRRLGETIKLLLKRNKPDG